MRRALTMIEMLLSLSLLSLLMLAVAAWTQTTARASVAYTEPQRWQLAAQAVLQLVHDDLVTGDYQRRQASGAQENARVKIESSTLSITTRDAGREIVRDYKFDPMRRQLELTCTHGQGLQRIRLVLTQVDQWQPVIDEDQHVLSVAIKPLVGEPVARSYLLP